MTKATPVYLLDASVFITPSFSYYHFEIAPAYWKAITDLYGRGTVRSIEEVRLELVKGGGPLWDWASRLPKDFWLSCVSDPVLCECYGKILDWISRQDFTQDAVDKFASGADGWLIAAAQRTGYTVVTQEGRVDAKCRGKVQIPNICDDFGVPRCNLFRMLRNTKTRFT